MKYISYLYAYLFFVIAIFFIDFLLYIIIGPAFFSVEFEITTNWFIAAILSSMIWMPIYILGVVILELFGHIGKIDLTKPFLHLSIWAFVSSIFLQLGPVIDFLSHSVWGSLLSFFIGAWLPMVITSFAYFMIKSWRIGSK